jgi:hypothetical protein
MVCVSSSVGVWRHVCCGTMFLVLQDPIADTTDETKTVRELARRLTGWILVFV